MNLFPSWRGGRPVAGLALLLLSCPVACGDDSEAQGTGGGGGTAATSGTTTTSASSTSSSTTNTSSTTTAASTSSSGGEGGSGAGGGSGGGGQVDVGEPFAFSAWYLGDTTREGVAAGDAWEGFAVDLDGLDTSTLDGEGHCEPQGNANPLVDAEGGGDNSFGKNILPLLSSLVEDPSDVVTASFVDGFGTLAIDLPDLGAGPDGAVVRGALRPLQDRAGDTWQHDPLGLQGGDEELPEVVFNSGSLSAQRWVSGPPQPLRIRLHLGAPLDLELVQAVVEVELDEEHASGADGRVTGILDTEAFVSALGLWLQAMGGGQEGLCPGDALYESVMQTVRNAQDIPLQGEHIDGVDCDGISLGIGFEVERAAVQGVGEPNELVDSCD